MVQGNGKQRISAKVEGTDSKAGKIRRLGSCKQTPASRTVPTDEGESGAAQTGKKTQEKRNCYGRGQGNIEHSSGRRSAWSYPKETSDSNGGLPENDSLCREKNRRESYTSHSRSRRTLRKNKKISGNRPSSGSDKKIRLTTARIR